MAHHSFEEGKGKFIEPGKVAMPAWRTVLIVLYTISLLLWGFVSGRVKKLFSKKSSSK